MGPGRAHPPSTLAGRVRALAQRLPRRANDMIERTPRGLRWISSPLRTVAAGGPEDTLISQSCRRRMLLRSMVTGGVGSRPGWCGTASSPQRRAATQGGSRAPAWAPYSSASGSPPVSSAGMRELRPGHELAARSVRCMMGADTTASGAHSPAAANMTIA